MARVSKLTSGGCGASWIRFANKRQLAKALAVLEDVPLSLLGLPGRELVVTAAHLAVLRAAKVKFSVVSA